MLSLRLFFSLSEDFALIDKVCVTTFARARQRGFVFTFPHTLLLLLHTRKGSQQKQDSINYWNPSKSVIHFMNTNQTFAYFLLGLLFSILSNVSNQNSSHLLPLSWFNLFQETPQLNSQPRDFWFVRRFVRSSRCLRWINKFIKTNSKQKLLYQQIQPTGNKRTVCIAGAF